VGHFGYDQSQRLA